jgi:hypothetical protein
MADLFKNDPYFDDYNVQGSDGLTPQEKYYRILFRPSVAVQARELTQLQSILQNQITQFGKHMFKDGSMVIPGGTSLDTQYAYVKLNALSGAGADVANYYSEFLNTTITGQTSGLEAEVINVLNADTVTGDLITLYVKYINSGTDNTSTFFSVGEEIVSNALTPRSATVATDGVGYGSAFSVNDGVYFVNGIFCTVRAQTAIISKYSSQPSALVGFDIAETLVTSQHDITLNDNATGAPNYAAPGAHRYSIELTLSSKAIDSTDLENFVQLIKVEDGVVRQQVVKTDYSLLEDTLARRTFDESGNYTVRPFGIEVREHLNDGTNRGIYTSAEKDSNGDFGDETKLAIGLERGKAYVRGYEIETLATTYVPVNKSREFESDNNVAIPFNLGNYLEVDNLYGVPNVNIFPIVSLRDAPNTSGGSASGNEIGTANVRVVEHFSGTGGSSTATYRFFLFNIQMNSGQVFTSTKSLYIPGTPPCTADVVAATASLANTQYNRLIVPMPYNVIKTISDTNYSVRKHFSGTLNGSGLDSISAGTDNQFLSPYSIANYLLVVDHPTNGWTVIDIDPGVTIEATGTPVGSSLLISLGATYANAAYSIITTVYKSTASEKSKTLTNATLNVPMASAAGTVSMQKADIYQVEGIYMSAGSGTPATISDQNIIDRYTIDNGQRDNFYDVGSIRLNNSAAAPTGDILIKFKYFEHGAGDYFTVDSYVDIDYGDIPSYQSSGTNYELRDVLDFRPRKSDDGTNFVTGGGEPTEILQIGSNLRCDFEYYLARIDKIFLDGKGKFGVVEGVPALNPSVPRSPDDAMVLYEIRLNPYTFGIDAVTSTMLDNRRYTMRDIGRLEKRIKNLEYYTSLSLLEKETADLQIPDALNVDRFKNGFIVDPFYGHGVGNPKHKDYKIAVDSARGHIRPQHYTDSIRLVNDTSSTVNMVKRGDALMLPYTQVEYAKQPYASRTENVTPYLVFNWIGDAVLSPDNDDWKETTDAPEFVVDNRALFDVVDLLEAQGMFGSIWNEWQVNWTGEPVISERVVGRRTDTIETIQSTEARDGIRFALDPMAITESMGERVLDVGMIPYIRARRVCVKASRLKPNTRFYAFFENIPVSQFCKPAAFLDYAATPWDAEPNVDAVRHPDLTATDITNETNALISDANGDLELEFYIPRTASIKFRTGDRSFSLVDDSQNREGFITSGCGATYSARGLTQQVQEVSIRQPNITTEALREVSQPFVSSSRVISSVTAPGGGGGKGGFMDPLAQTFIVDTAGGIMVSKIDVFFYTIDPNIPVKMEIRTVTNGYPTNTIVPLAEKSLLLTAANVSTDASIPTTFEFDTPIYLNQAREYAIVLKSASDQFRVFISRLGENQIGTTQRISKQPTLGSLFKSQNATTWEASQLDDLKYTMYRAKFNTSTVGTVYLNNNDVPTTSIPNPIYTTSGSNIVVIEHKNHGMSAGGKVEIVSMDSTSVNGIPSSELVGQHYINNIEQDRYTITVTTAATANGNSGGIVVLTEDKKMDIFQPTVNMVRFPDTNVTWAAKLTTARSLAGTEDTYNLDSSFRPVLSNENYQLPAVHCVASSVNENLHLSGAKSFVLRGYVSTLADNVSPMIDLTRCSVITVNNRIDNPQAISGTESNSNTVLNFVDETNADDCSALARYITKKIALKESSEALKIIFAANRPDGSNIEVYYKTQSTGDDSVFDELPWISATPENVPLTNEDTSKFEDYEYLNEGMTAFKYFAVKIVMKSQNSSKVPRVKDFRAIALAV